MIEMVPDPTQSQSDPDSYRFMDDAVTSHVRSNSSPTYSVEFYPSVDDYVELAVLNANRYPQPTLGKIAVYAYLILNALGLPAVLFYFDYTLAAILIFAINCGFAIFVLPAMFKADYRKFYEHVHPQLEEKIVRVELNEAGLFSRSGAEYSFISWDSIVAIDETKSALIFTIRGGNGIAVGKSGFAYAQEAEDFLSFAKSQQKSLTPSNGPIAR
jgi:YcxB-like protein